MRVSESEIMSGGVDRTKVAAMKVLNIQYLSVKFALLSAFALAIISSAFIGNANAEDAFKLGADTCGGECHEAELEVWQGSPHQLSFEKFDDPSDDLAEKVEAILEAVGSDDMTESPVCTTCHFTMVQEAADEEPYADSGPSCESCHGAGSKFKDVHSDQDVEYDQRMAKAESLGMIRPTMKFDIAQNCNGCHAMERPEVDGATIDKMISAGHPIKADFELVQYSQGAVRHRFYEPDTTVNAKMTKPELAHLFVEGQLAQYLAAHKSLKKSPNAEYQAVMQTRVNNAKAALAPVPGADAFLGNPSAGAARTLLGTLKNVDLTDKVGSSLPAESTYK